MKHSLHEIELHADLVELDLLGIEEGRPRFLAGAPGTGRRNGRAGRSSPGALARSSPAFCRTQREPLGFLAVVAGAVVQP